MHKQVPYNTGKVKIGIRYTPKQRIEMNDTMVELQRTLLRKKIESRTRAAADFTLYIVCCIAIGVIVLTWK